MFHFSPAATLTKWWKWQDWSWNLWRDGLLEFMAGGRNFDECMRNENGEWIGTMSQWVRILTSCGCINDEWVRILTSGWEVWREWMGGMRSGWEFWRVKDQIGIRRGWKWRGVSLMTSHWVKMTSAWKWRVDENDEWMKMTNGWECRVGENENWFDPCGRLTPAPQSYHTPRLHQLPCQLI